MGSGRWTTPSVPHAMVCGLLLLPVAGSAQEERSRPEEHEGSAVVRVDDGEYKIVILCEDPARPELGFRTQPNRLTREANGGRYNMVNLRLRTWQDTDEVVVSLERYVAWMSRPASPGNGVLSLTLDMSPASTVQDGMPVALTYDKWTSGERPPGLEAAHFEANCATRDPEAPAYRKVPS